VLPEARTRPADRSSVGRRLAGRSATGTRCNRHRRRRSRRTRRALPGGCGRAVGPPRASQPARLVIGRRCRYRCRAVSGAGGRCSSRRNSPRLITPSTRSARSAAVSGASPLWSGTPGSTRSALTQFPSVVSLIAGSRGGAGRPRGRNPVAISGLGERPTAARAPTKRPWEDVVAGAGSSSRARFLDTATVFDSTPRAAGGIRPA